MARRRITVEDDAEILVHWRAGRGIRQIAPTGDGSFTAVRSEERISSRTSSLR